MMPKRGVIRTLIDVVAYVLLLPASQLAAALIAGAKHISTFGIRTPAMIMEELQRYIAQNTTRIMLISYVLVIGVLLLLRVRGRRSLIRETGLSRGISGGMAVNFLVLGISLNVALSLALTWLPLPEGIMEQYVRSSETLTSQDPWMDLVALVLMAPLVEELVFRGIILPRLKGILPVGLAVLTQGLLFGLMHGDLLWIAYTSVVGILLGVIRVRTRSLWPPLLAHLAFNGGAAVYLLLEERPLLAFIGAAGLLSVCLIITFRHRWGAERDLS